MKRISYLLLLLIVTSLISCTKKSKKAEEVIKSFYAAATNSLKGIKPMEYYPEFDSLHIKLKSDVINFGDKLIERNDTMIMTCQNNYTDEKGTFRQDSIRFYLIKGKRHYQIVDSKGIIQIPESLKVFGKKIGVSALDKIRDVQLASLLSKLNDFYLSKFLDAYIELSRNVKILTWSWETDDDGEPSGEASFYNNSSIILSNIIYTIKYYNRNGNIISEDTGNACNELKPHEKCRFTFYSSNVINPAKASLTLDFDNSNIEQILQSMNYTKNDFEKYDAKHSILK